MRSVLQMVPARAISCLRFCLMTLALLLCGGMIESVQAELQVSPTRVEFRDAYQRQQLLVESAERDLTGLVEYQIADPAVARVDASGFLEPVGQGETILRITHASGKAEIPVMVSSFDQERRIDFANEVQPLLTRYSCNSGGCHGKASGQNGFRLSLFGFDDEFDYEAIVQASRGRRVFVPAPETSLFLQKASNQIPHGGGQRLKPDSEPYQILVAWIAFGAPRSQPDVARVTSIAIEPTERLFQPGQSQQLRVTASYSDGSVRDVTRQADYASNLDVVASVNEQGVVQARELSGEATIMARYMGQVAVFRSIRPHGQPLEQIAGFVPANRIDELAVAKWQKLGLQPSEVCDDTTFLRRITIDLAGRLPTISEVEEFLASADSDKRNQAIQRLLDSPEYPAYFAMKWSVILRNSRLAGADQAAYAFHNWIKEMIARNRPYDEFVRGIVAASGEWQDAPAINWFWQSRDDQLHTVTADTAQLFLGIRLQCARCHHHPYERWGQADYYGLAGFYARLGRKSFGQPPPYYTASSVKTGEKNPLTGKPPEPKYPDGAAVEFTPEQDPRHALVDWMAQPDNPFFAKAYVNRMWSHFFGQGLVNEVDDMRQTNPPSNPEILDYLAAQFIESGFDTRQLITLIVSSRLYQLSAEPQPANQNDQQNFARFYARRLIAEVLHDAVDQACGTQTKFNNMSGTARAIDLPHEGFSSYFMDTFDRPQRVSVCECERSPGATLAQVLLMANSDEMENRIASGQGRIEQAFKDNKPVDRLVEELYLVTVSRYPEQQVKQEVVTYIEQSEDKKKAAQDLLWTLINSREFLFTH